MTDKSTAQQTDVSTDSVTQELISSTNTNTNIAALKASPVFGWLFAGTDLLSSALDQAAGLVSQKLDETHEAIQSMQNKGLEVESELKRVLNPFAWMDSAQQVVTSNPLLSLLPGAQKRQKKAQQIELLNAKVELLVEQVALLAAKEAAAKAKKAPTAKAEAKETAATTAPKTTAPKKASRSTSTKRSTTKTAASKSTATKPTASNAATAKSSSAKATTTRKRATTASRKATTATKASSAKGDSTAQAVQSTENKSSE